MNLYLNLDGVLHPNQVEHLPGQAPELKIEGHRVLEHAHLLTEVLAGHEGVGIVLNTWWTFYLDLDACVEMLPVPLGRRVIGATLEHASRYDSVPSRPIETEKHIARHGQRCFIVLDHNDARYRVEMLPRLLLLDPDEGLDALAARRRLATRLTRNALD